MLGGEFLKYMEAFKPFLGIGLKNYAEYQVGCAFGTDLGVTVGSSAAAVCNHRDFPGTGPKVKLLYLLLVCLNQEWLKAVLATPCKEHKNECLPRGY